MKKQLLLFLSFLGLTITACNNQSAPEPEDDPKKDVHVNVRMDRSFEMMGGTKSFYELDFTYNDDFFSLHSATRYNEKIRDISFGLALSSGTRDYATKFYTNAGFDNLQIIGYSSEETLTSFAIAHRAIDDFDLISLTVQGILYEEEWANNFTIGLNGNHTGFSESADKVYETLNNYINNNYKDSKIKLWISAYSRGAGISNCLAHKLFKGKDDIKVKKENTFIYTFATPASLTKENAVKYENVFNIINELDIVASVPPQEYELYRCGNDVILTPGADLVDKLSVLNPGFIFPEFTNLKCKESEFNPDGLLKSDKELKEYVLRRLLENIEEDTEHTNLGTREEYYNNYQTHIAYLISFYFTVPSNVFSEVVNTITEMEPRDLLSLMTENGIYNFLKPFLDNNGVVYDENMLRPATEVARKLINAKFSIIALFIDTSTFTLNQNTVSNFVRLGYMHCKETYYSLLFIK